MKYYIRVFQNYVNFQGRDSRKQYWMFVLINIIVSGILFLISSLIGDSYQILSNIYGLALLVPGLAISIRRMHDIGKSGWWILIDLIPIIGVIWYIVLLCQPSQEGVNQYGDMPFDD